MLLFTANNHSQLQEVNDYRITCTSFWSEKRTPEFQFTENS
jgi:hypothetical protein